VILAIRVIVILWVRQGNGAGSIHRVEIEPQPPLYPLHPLGSPLPLHFIPRKLLKFKSKLP
jgi:hypothetical protein